MAEKKELAVQQPQNPTMSERFTNMVLSEFGGNVAGALQVTAHQRQLIQGYFIVIDKMLKAAEEDRVRKNASNSDHKYDKTVPYDWNHVNLPQLALDLVHYARMGLDMTQDNMLFPIPFENRKTKIYDINLMPGYNGIRYTAEKYAIDPPKAVVVEVVYSTDRFKPIKKDAKHDVESYEFEIVNPFDRGKIVGGFAYLQFNEPTKNKLIIMTMEAIYKRKPKYASANFWGGKTTEWQGGKKVEVETEGWLEEMVSKTIKREAYSSKHLPRDPQKIDDSYQYAMMREARYAEIEAQAEIDANANAVPIDTQPRPAISQPATVKVIPATTAEETAAPSAPTAPNAGGGTPPVDGVDGLDF